MKKVLGRLGRAHMHAPPPRTYLRRGLEEEADGAGAGLLRYGASREEAEGQEGTVRKHLDRCLVVGLEFGLFVLCAWMCGVGWLVGLAGFPKGGSMSPLLRPI